MSPNHDHAFAPKSIASLILPAILAAAAIAAPASAQCTGFTLTQSAGAIVPGTANIGNSGDDVVTNITLPFAVTLYGAAYTSAAASSNGNLQFGSGSSAYNNDCLPNAAFGVALLPHWDDLRTDGPGEGIFTSISGVAPNRVFNIEWRTSYFSGGGSANFEIRLFEDQSHVEFSYGEVAGGGSGATVGAQHTIFPATQFQCNAGGLTAGLLVNLACTTGPIPPAGNGTATPSTVNNCESGSATLLMVTVASGFNPPSTGLAVTGNLTSIGGSSTQSFFNDGTHGDANPGDGVFTFQAAVPSSVTTGNKSFPFTVTDAQSRSGAGTFGLQVNSCPTLGPDVFVFNLIDVANWGSVGNITAYSVGTDACNAGDVPVAWFASVNQHPVIAQNMYRLKSGRFEQLGQSWLKHGFSSTNSLGCGSCQQPPSGGQQLGVGCTDAYGSGLNGSQGNLGPRSQVNATTGAYPYPFNPSMPGASATIGRRLQVFTSDVDPALNGGAQYFVECHYITADDAQSSVGAAASNGLNNSSYRRISIANTTAAPGFVGNTIPMTPAIQAWQTADPTVQLVAADYLDTSLTPVGIKARFWVGAKVSDNGNGTWHYEYAIHNLNSDRCAGSFSVPVPAGVTVTNIDFHGIFAHSGEPFPNTASNLAAWPGAHAGGAVTWAVPQAYIAPGHNANALRWGTMYNFRFDANVAPAAGTTTIGLFKPPTAGSITSVAAAVSTPGTLCRADYNRDGSVGVQDIFDFLAAYFSNSPAADINGVGGVTVQDIFDYLALYFAGCA